MVLRRIFGSKGDVVTVGWKELLNEDLHDLYSSPSIIRIISSRRIKWAGHVDRKRGKRNVYNFAYKLFLRKRPLGRPGYRWIDNIKIDLGEREWDCVDLILPAQDKNTWRALVRVAMKLRVA
jgi:hypothetical protein